MAVVGASVNGWISVATALVLAIVIADIAVRERRIERSVDGVKRVLPPLALRISLLFFAAYAPFAWLVWFNDSPEYRRQLLALWLAFPGVVSAQAIVSIVSRSAPSPVITSMVGIALSAGFAWIALSIARRGWVWTIAAAGFTAAVCAALSVVSYALARM